MPHPYRTPGGHTTADYATFVRAGCDPFGFQPRERAVRCQECGARTWNLTACCDRHYRPPVRVGLAP